STPLPLVVARCSPRTVPPPVAIPAIPPAPALLSTLSLPDALPISGCCAKGTPLWAVAEGSVVTVNWVAVPAVSVTVAELTPVSPVAEKLGGQTTPVNVSAWLVTYATPGPVVVAVRVPPSVPPPVAIAAVTVTPAWLPGLPPPFPYTTLFRSAKGTPLWAVAEGSVVTVNWVAVPAVSVTVAELTPVSPVAEKLGGQTTPVNVSAWLVTYATPGPVVVAVRVPPSVPPPVAIAAVTVTPAWLPGLPPPFPYTTLFRSAKGTPLCAVADGCVVTVNWVAVPAVSVTVAELTLVSPVAEKLRVRSPAVPVIERLGKGVNPSPVLVADSVPPMRPPPVGSAAVTYTLSYRTGLPLDSRSFPTRRSSDRTPLCAVADGCVVTVNWVAVPAVSVTVAELTLVSPVAEKLRVRSPAVPV